MDSPMLPQPTMLLTPPSSHWLDAVFSPCPVAQKVLAGMSAGQPVAFDLASTSPLSWQTCHPLAQRLLALQPAPSSFPVSSPAAAQPASAAAWVPGIAKAPAQPAMAAKVTSSPYASR